MGRPDVAYGRSHVALHSDLSSSSAGADSLRDAEKEFVDWIGDPILAGGGEYPGFAWDKESVNGH